MNAPLPVRTVELPETWAWKGPPEPASHRFTLDEVLAIQAAGIIHPDARIELLDGEIIDMPEEGALHVWFKVELVRFLVPILPDNLRLAPDATLSLAPTEAPDPDIYIFPTGLQLRLTPGPELRLIIEIADSSLTHDLRRKADKYASNGVPEYWVIDIRGRRTFVHLQPEDGAYLERAVVAFDQPLTPTRIDGVRLVIADLPRFDGLSFD